MNPPALPQRILDFVAASIDSVPQMEALLLFREDPTRAWPADEIAARIYVTAEAAMEIVRSLERRHLVRAEGADPPRWRFSPASDSEAALIAEVAAAYRTHLVALATYIHSKASSSVREFARAFDLKKDR